MRVIVRREPIAVDSQVSLFEQLDGYRYQVIVTNTPGGQVQRLEARHRVQARVEARIRTGKDTGLARLLTLDGKLARPNPGPCATGCCTWPRGSCTGLGRIRIG